MPINTEVAGIHTGMPFAEYRTIDAINISTLKKVDQSPRHAQHDIVNPPEPSPAFLLGHAFHTLVLEPGIFGEEFALGLDRGHRSKADKEAWDVWEEANGEVTPLKPDDWDAIHYMTDAVLAHTAAAEILGGAGRNEVTMIWEDPETGALCKGRADRITSFGDSGQGWSVIADLKSTINASPEDWGKSAARFFYHSQAAWYLDGADVLAPRDRRFLFICVEKKPPYGVTVQELNEEAIDAGRKLNRIWLDRWLRCVETSVWTGYPEGVISQELPRWALRG